MLTRQAKLEGCLLGCAVGDSICLPYEGMSPRRIAKIARRPLGQRFVIGRGMVSDDTDHSIFVAQALAKYPNDPARFARCLAWRFRFWLVCMPAGIGLATLNSILKLWMGFPPSRSGVFSAGNGPAMRSAIIGAVHATNAAMRTMMVSCSSKMTHSDPKANFGALSIAELAALLMTQPSRPSLAQVESLLGKSGEGPEWQDVVERTVLACKSGLMSDAVLPEGLKRGVSGYIYHTLPVAIAAWYIHFGDFRNTIETVAFLGGDTDTIAAIAGALAGITVGRAGIPQEWIHHLTDYPHSPQYITSLSEAVDNGGRENTRFSWLLLPRGAIFTSFVLAHGFRRLLPPY